MKRFLQILFFILFFQLIGGNAYAFKVFGVEAPAKVFGVEEPAKVFGVETDYVAVCIKDTSNLVMDQTASDTGKGLDVDASGQSISYASGWNLHSFNIEFGGATTGTCTVTVRIGTSTNLSSYMEEWASVVISDGGETKEFVSVDQDAYSSSTTYYFGIVEDSGTCIVRVDQTSPTYAGGIWYDYTTDNGWVLGTTNSGTDASMQVFKCE